MVEEYATILLQKGELWALKSRLNATTFGDRNTSYFHLSTIVRRHRNKIRGIKNREGEWMFEEDQVREHIHRGFYDLYSTDLEKSCLNSLISSFSCRFFSEKEQERIGREVLEEDIRVGLWALKAFKAPGRNGLHAGFFQHFWHDVKQLVCDEIKNCFAQGCIPDYLNETLITLIPKCQCPEILLHYKPISLCNSIYKVILKIIMGRIRPYLSNLILPLQATFIPGRRGLDNVLIAQEMIYVLDRKKGKDGYMAIKVDLEKVYDRLEWSFIPKYSKLSTSPYTLPNLS